MLRLGDLMRESVGGGALVLPCEGSRANPLLGRRSLGLGGDEGRGECSFGQSSSGDVRRPAKGVGALGARGISQGRSRGTNGGGSGRRASRAIEGRAGRVRGDSQGREACRGVRSAQA